MKKFKTSINRRSFIKSSSLVSGGLMVNFCWLVSCDSMPDSQARFLPEEWFDFNGYLKISESGKVTIMSPNPEGGQNVKTSMPMIVAEELDIQWEDVIVEQAELNTSLYSRQFIGGSQSIRQSWNALRIAGASARYMLMQAAAQSWKVPIDEITTDRGKLKHFKSGRIAHYGEMASVAAQIPVPEEVTLKKMDSFTIIGTSPKNVDAQKIVTGQPLYGIDTFKKGMLIAMIVHPPAFGMKFKAVNAQSELSMPGIHSIFPIKVLNDDYVRQHFDTCTFLEVIAIVGYSTWEVMNAKKSIQIEWEPIDTYTEQRIPYGGEQSTIVIPNGLENTSEHQSNMEHHAKKKGKIERRDGNPELEFKKAIKIIERTYTAPFLAHNCMEPLNFYADVTDQKAELIGPLQKAELTEQALSARLGIPIESIDIKMTRLGGGYGRRSYAHWAIEAALISQKVQVPVKLIYSREDDMTGGIYRPAYRATYRAALDKDNNLTAIHINAGGILESPLFANRFPAGAVDHYLAESWTISSNISIGSFRAPRSNFMAGAEQSFLDELAEEMGKDPIQFRLDLLQRAKENPVGERNEYDAERYAGVLELLKEKSKWGKDDNRKHRGVSAYFCHNTYAAHVLDLVIEDGKPVVENVCCTIDCGIVVNPDSAINMAEGSIIDGIGNAFYGAMTFKDGRPEKTNFDQYRMIRMSEAPKAIDVHFVKNEINPTGMGEPPFPPIFGAVANAMYKATKKRYYDQPFLGDKNVLG